MTTDQPTNPKENDMTTTTETTPAVALGQRVRLQRVVERFPHFVAEAGMRGTISIIAPDHVAVHLDEHLAGAEEWDNEIMWSADDAPNGDPIAAMLSDVGTEAAPGMGWLTDDELNDAADEAGRKARQRGATPEYREWWSARERYVKGEVETREARREVMLNGHEPMVEWGNPRCPACGAGMDNLELSEDDDRAFCGACATESPSEACITAGADERRFMVCVDGGDPSTISTEGVNGIEIPERCHGLDRWAAMELAEGLADAIPGALVTLVMEVPSDA